MSRNIERGEAAGSAAPPTDIEIARRARLEPILTLAEARLGLAPEHLIPFGHHRAKLSLDLLDALRERPRGRLVVVSAITPTPAGEGKTTACVGLVDALNRLGVTSLACLREPSLGPVFGMKGGAAGGGHAQAVPMEAINLHFNGDFHAVTAAHNLLAALVDNHLYWGNALDIDPERVTWTRVLDLNDRSLRRVRTALDEARGGEHETGFEITAASEIMAILCLAEDLDDLQRRLGRIVVAWRKDDTPVTAADLQAVGAMAVLLRDALAPNLVQTLEQSPVLIHGGPFANIAHGCSSLVATRAALALGEVVVTEAGFGADQGLEKFVDIKSRQSGLTPDAVVMVCTLRALRFHGGASREAMDRPDPEAVTRGLGNLARQVAVARCFGLSPVVALNTFPTDSAEERERLAACCERLEVALEVCDHWARGGPGALSLARRVLERLEEGGQEVAPLYADGTPLEAALTAVATRLYGARGIELSAGARQALAQLERAGYGHLPVCIARTQFSFSDDPADGGLVEGHLLRVSELRLSAGAGFVVAICGRLMTLPGLPRKPAALGIGLDAQGNVIGLA
ncbi:formate--tetrahydrofolate ligase [Halomonas campaniensis]|uniref:Formate--tetrahydrofolate ligase n=1 Tax=Halomonas campaniensis TaxID=213554 RepID=A0A7W5PCQ6_9GAMM|nr:formate--tetrahydrofolate ligase [Halomonas campaniensis]MBB3332286.1 formate--tetrahydrofolate ligase [Halomonas campaniensis]